jgi:Tfp pilus assembly protein PilF
MMDPLIGISSAAIVDSFFSATAASQDQLDNLANSALSRGIDLYTKQHYSGAVVEFRSAIGLSPSSDNSAKAYDYMAQAYLKQNKTADAIKTYKEAISVNPSNDGFHLSLGDIYFKNGQQSEAEAEYLLAVRLNPNSADDRYSLGQAYLASGRVSESEVQFERVTKLVPNSSTGYYGLGQAFRQAGKSSDAISQLNKAITLDKNFANAYLELGKTYADMGDMDQAKEQSDILQGMDTSLSSDLQSYMNQVTDPKFQAVYSATGFDTFAGPKTPVSALDPALSSPNASNTFTLNFAFSKEMDIDSVQNITNWQISRQSGPYASDDYNFGMPLPSTEVNLPPMPSSVAYNPESRTAVVTFRIAQNAAGDGTIDPSHIAFKFNGIDAYGKAMDSTADEYSGFSAIV